MTTTTEAGTPPEALFQVTPAAAARARELLAARGRAGATLRVFIAGRHGNGFQYGLALAGEPDADDLTIAAGEVRFIVDLVSAPFLSGATIDYVDEPLQQGFVIGGPAPRAGGGCACGRGGCGCGRR
ncbi:MAG TPA: iron-sulfur cluster assembly accessory protein [Dehalococcoidia bacterium]|nr:iron-sulfur cluster assembly accessory protein [Dehalococcoidia bacterium]